MKTDRRRWLIAILCFALVCPVPAPAQKKVKKEEKQEAQSLPALIWQGHVNVAKLNLMHGAGGAKDAPDPNATYKFIIHPSFDAKRPIPSTLSMHTRPFFASRVKHRYYSRHTGWERTVQNIPRADAKWLGEQLARLSDAQIRDCFRAAGYTQEQVDGYTRTVEKHIQQLTPLESASPFIDPSMQYRG